MSTDSETTIDHLFAPENPVSPSEQQPAPPEVDYGFNPQQQPVPPAPPAEVPQPAPQAPQVVPLAELIETRRRAQAAEERQRGIEAQNAQLLEALSRLTRPQQPEPEPLDPVADPETAFLALRREMQEGQLNTHLNNSERFARYQLGNEVVNQALQAAREAGMTETFKYRQDPYGEMVQWYQGQKLQQEIGTDPAAYRARIAAEIKAELLAQMRGGQSVPPNLPPSLSQATKANGAPEILGSDKDFFSQTINRRG